MGCAQETFEAILSYLHREYVEPNYLEAYIKADKDLKFKMDNELDEKGCSPHCAPHHTFGIEACDMVQCLTCGSIGQIREIGTPQFIHQVYVAEIQAIQEMDPSIFCTLPLIIDNITRGENEIKLERLKR